MCILQCITPMETITILSVSVLVSKRHFLSECRMQQVGVLKSNHILSHKNNSIRIMCSGSYVVENYSNAESYSEVFPMLNNT